MVAPKTAYKAYVVSGDPASPQLIQRALAWLAAAPPLGAPALLLVPSKDQITGTVLATAIGDQQAKSLAAGKDVRLGTRPLVAATPRTLPRLRWPGGPILALWTDDDALDSLHARPGISAVCAIGWGKGDIERWVRTYGPQDLSTGGPAATPSPNIDPVVVAALRSLTDRVNLSTGLGHPLDRDAAIHAFQVLRNAGYILNSEDIHVWAMQNGWRPQGAAALADVVSKVAAGRRLATTNAASWSDEILELWRADASGRASSRQ